MYLSGDSPIRNGRFVKVGLRDYASFIHEYVHYIQQITTPYGLKYSSYFNNMYLLYRNHVDSKVEVILPICMDGVVEPMKQMEKELGDKNGSRFFSKGNVDDIEIKEQDINLAKKEDTAVNIGVYDFENDRAFEEGFGFGYWCVIESMAHLVQSLVNPELYHATVPYDSARLVCTKVRPDLADDTRLLISVCYISLFFNNPGSAFFEILMSVPQKGENGVDLFKRYMRNYSRVFQGQEMHNYRMMYIMMDDFVHRLEALIGTEMMYYNRVFENCKMESSIGDSLFLNMVYYEDFKDVRCINDLLNFYGYPAIDSLHEDIVVPIDPSTLRPYKETASLVSLELLIDRFEGNSEKKKCLRFSKCNRDRRNNIIELHCVSKQWLKTKDCLFKSGLHYFQWENKKFV